MARQQEAWYRRRRSLPVWPAAVLVTIAFGVWGFTHLEVVGPDGTVTPLGPVESLYHTARLFAFEFDVPPGMPAPWQLWLAAFAAPLLTLRGIARLFSEQLSGMLTHYFVRPRLVIFGANERSAALVKAEPRPGRWRDAIVVADPDPQALGTVVAPRVWTVRGQGTSAASLRHAAVPRAKNVVVLTGDNVRNSAITTAVLDLRPKPELDVFVEVEEAGLARTLEQGGQRVGIETVPFSASALGAATVLDELEADLDDGAPGALLAAEPDGTAPALALFGTGGLVDAFVLELHRRRQVQLLEAPAATGAAPRVLLFGPDAVARRRSLATLVGTDLQLLDLDAFDVRLDQVVELEIETARHLARNRPLRQVFVLAPSDLDGGGIAITLARHLGPAAQLVIVTETGSTPFADEIEEQSQESATLARVRLFRIPERAYRLPTLQAERVADRLAQALHTSDTSGRVPWSGLTTGERDERRARAGERLHAAGEVPLRRSALVAPSPAEIPLLEALGFDRPTALARAGLGADFQSVAVLVPAAERLLATGHEAAFGTWCEVARLHTRADELARITPAEDAGPDAGDVRDLLLLRRAQLRDAHALAGVRRRAGDAVAAATDVVVLMGGQTDTLSLELLSLELLEPTLQHLPAGTDLRLVMPAGKLRDALRRRGARPFTQGADATRDAIRDATRDATRDAVLGTWRAFVASGQAGDRVRVVALPGTSTEDLLLVRALGATIGRVEAPDAADLSRTMLNGADRVVPLPPDRMTVRAFLRPTTWPLRLADLREPLATELHRRYVARQRARKPQDDPALEAWSVLSPWLQRSNLAAVDDIPNKLAALGLRLDGRRDAAARADLVQIVEEHHELLAELEHGRYTAERLLSGWTRGVRDPARFLTPYLQPWDELDDEAREYDREVVRDLPEVLATYGLGVETLGD